MPMTLQTPLQQIEDLFTPELSASLASVRDNFLQERETERRDWYDAQLAKSGDLDNKVQESSFRTLRHIARGLDEKARRGESSLEITILDYRQTGSIGFKEFRGGQMESGGPFDIACQPTEHAVLVRSAKVVVEMLKRARLEVEESRLPASQCHESMVREIKLKVTIPDSGKLSER